MTATLAKLLEAQPLRDISYVAAAIACLLVGLFLEQRPGKDTRAQANFWLGLTTLLLVLAAMKVIGVQDAVLHRVREFAWDDGWYSSRRPLQAKIIGAILVAVGIFLAIVLYKLHSLRGSLGAPVIAVTFLLTFILIRAISLHQVDSLIYRSDFAGVQVSAIAELSLVLLVLATALATWIFYVALAGPSGPSDAAAMRGRPMTLATASAPLPASSSPSAPRPASSRKSKRKKRRKH